MSNRITELSIKAANDTRCKIDIKVGSWNRPLPKKLKHRYVEIFLKIQVRICIF